MIYRKQYAYSKPLPGVQLNNSHPLSQGLVSLWLFNEKGGTTLHDIAGLGNTGTLTNMNVGSDWIIGDGGSALDFDGVDDYIGTGFFPASGAEPRTVIITAMVRAVESTYFAWGTSTVDGQSVIITAIDVSGTKYVLFRHIGGNIRYPGIALNKFHTIAFVVPRGSTTTDDVRVFIDGTLSVGTRNAGADQTLNTGTASTLRVGGSPFANPYLDGSIRNFIAYDRELSTQEIMSLHRNPYQMLQTGINVSLFGKAPAAVGATTWGMLLGQSRNRIVAA